MSLLVTGTVMTARTDVRLAQVHLARAQVTAAGDGAINLLLADLLDGRFQDRRSAAPGPLAQGRYRLGGDEVSVLAVAESLLVDVATATPALLAALIETTGAADGAAGEGLARAVVQYRDGRGRRGMAGFDSIEDLLAVRGMNRATLDALRDYISVAGGAITAAGGVGAQPAIQQATLLQLQNLAPVTRAADPGLRSLPVSEALAATGAGGRFRIDALVRRGNDVWLRRRWVNLGGGNDGLPWRFTRTEPVRMVPRGT
jgi:hypothetical protein